MPLFIVYLVDSAENPNSPTEAGPTSAFAKEEKMSAHFRYSAAVLVSLLSLLPASAQQPAGWRDPSPHASKLESVEDGVQLEVLEWGGAGRPILLLAGLGDT